jgi:hypothetical protein
LCRGALFESRVLSTYLSQSKAIEPSLHPINRVLVVRVGLASHRHLQVVGAVLSYWVGKLSHALLYGYMLLEIIMAYFIVVT